VILDQVQRPVQMAACFLMNRDPVDACIGKNRDKFIRILNH
jgi:hypothetical protein